MIKEIIKNGTEILTNEGWKDCNLITNDSPLAFVDDSGNMKFSNGAVTHSNMSGIFLEFENRYCNFILSSRSHIMIKYLSRRAENDFSIKEDITNLNNFSCVSLDEYFKRRKNHARILHVPLLVNKVNDNLFNYEELMLLGAYISDGHIVRNKEIRIDQKEDKQLFKFLNNSSFRKKASYKGSLTGDTYYYFMYNNTKLLSYIKDNIGIGSLTKRLDFAVTGLDKQSFDIMLEGMINGDGSIHKKGHRIYYTSSKQLADDLHTLLFTNGYASQIYEVAHKGGFENSSDIKYQVFIPKNNVITGHIHKGHKWITHDLHNVPVITVESDNKNIITRRKNKITII